MSGDQATLPELILHAAMSFFRE